MSILDQCEMMEDSICELSEEAGVTYGSCHVTLTKDFGMRHVSTKIIPWLLTQKQKEMISDLHKCAETDENFLKM